MPESGKITISSASRPWYETRNGRTVVAAGVVGLFILVFWLATKSRQMLAALPPPLVVNDAYLWFGEVWEDPEFVWKLPIRNTAGKEVVIAGFDASCSCVKIEPLSVDIAAGATEEVRLTLNLVRVPRQADLEGKDFKVAIKPKIRGGAGPQIAWVVQGKVKIPFSLDPPVVDFEESLVRGQLFRARSADITSALDGAELRANCDSPFLTAKIIRDLRNPRKHRLEINAQRNIPSGPFSYLVKLTALLPDKSTASGVVSVVGRVQEDISLQPEVLAFGAAPIGTTMKETVLIQSRSGQKFTVEEILKQQVEGVTVDLHKKRNDGSQCLIVTSAVKQLGDQICTIHVKVKTLQGTLDLPLLLSCHGMPSQDGAALR